MKSIAIFSLGMCFGCASVDAKWWDKIFKKKPTYKVYFSRPDMGGIVRLQDEETILYKDSQGFVCMKAGTLEAIAASCKAGKQR
jgi:hypothetical protein